MKLLRSSATRTVSLVGFPEAHNGAGAGFVPLMRISNGDRGPRIVGAEETEMLFGHCALDNVSTYMELERLDVLVNATTLLWIWHIHANTPE